MQRGQRAIFVVSLTLLACSGFGVDLRSWESILMIVCMGIMFGLLATKESDLEEGDDGSRGSEGC